MKISPDRKSDSVDESFLDSDLVRNVVERLCPGEELSPDLAGLRTIYAAWCRSMPFDNVRKMISLRTAAGSDLIGCDAAEYFENWLRNGSGGTCWPSSNALFCLLLTLGFDVRRVAGSMFDIGIINHGSVKVKIDGQDWLADSSILSNIPLPLTDEIYVSDDPRVGVEVEPLDGHYKLWADFPPLPDYIPCRLNIDPVDLAFYRERYEFSREQSPFNHRLYLRKSGPSGLVVYLGHTRFAKTGDELDIQELTRDELCQALHEEVGLSEWLLEEWVSSGSLDATFEIAEAPPRPEIIGKRPSLRREHLFLRLDQE